jgi:hypothetical protein
MTQTVIVYLIFLQSGNLIVFCYSDVIPSVPTSGKLINCFYRGGNQTQYFWFVSLLLYLQSHHKKLKMSSIPA